MYRFVQMGVKIAWYYLTKRAPGSSDILKRLLVHIVGA